MSGRSFPYARLWQDTQNWQQFLFRWLIFGMLLSASWYLHPLFSLLCFVPYFVTLFRAKKNIVYYLQLFILNLTWNTAVTYWLCQLKLTKGLGTLFINSVLFLLPVLIWHLYTRYGRIKQGQPLALLLWWLIFEYAHHVWDFSWTWLTVGNVFGKAPQLVLWYSYLGVLGGSAWILCCNYLIYKTISRPFLVKKLYLPAMAISLPILLSIGIQAYRLTAPAGPTKEIAVVATAINNKDSISDISKIAIVDSLLSADHHPKAITLLPEVLLSDNVWLNRFPDSDVYAMFRHGFRAWRTSHIITGALLNVPDPDGSHTEERMHLEARYNSYNAALMMNPSDIINIKLKKIFVPVEEYVPSYLSFLGLKTYGFAKEPGNSDIFDIDGQHYFVAICYEAVNSIFMADRLQHNTNGILMLSSESFFGESETGRQQYMNICRLRCVENNLPLVKSSNEGIILAVNTNGDLIQVKRTHHPYLMRAVINLSSPSCYYMLVPYIFPLLSFLLGSILLINSVLNRLATLLYSPIKTVA